MKKTYWIVGIIIVVLALFFILSSKNTSQEEAVTKVDESDVPVQIIPITHATAVLSWGGTTIYTDPTGGEKAFEGQAPADIIVITDIHGDHLSTSTLYAVLGDATLIVPQAVKDMLPTDLASKAQVLKNGESTSLLGFAVSAVPMYNFPESSDSRHTKGRGNGYVIEKDSFRVYVAGDTSGTPEMRALKEIDIALIPMNLPFTMSVDEAADAVLAFKPRQVYPYHYRSQNGLSDINRFKELVNAGDPFVEVILVNWYPPSTQ